MSATKLTASLLAVATLAACYPAGGGQYPILAPRAEQVATSRPEIVRMRYGSEWAAHDSVGVDGQVDRLVAGTLIAWTIIHPAWLARMHAWPTDYRTGMVYPGGPTPDRLHLPLVRVTQPIPECTAYRPSTLPTRMPAWCPLVRLSLPVSGRDP